MKIIVFTFFLISVCASVSSVNASELRLQPMFDSDTHQDVALDIGDNHGRGTLHEVLDSQDKKKTWRTDNILSSQDVATTQIWIHVGKTAVCGFRMTWTASDLPFRLGSSQLSVSYTLTNIDPNNGNGGKACSLQGTPVGYGWFGNRQDTYVSLQPYIDVYDTHSVYHGGTSGSFTVNATPCENGTDGFSCK